MIQTGPSVSRDAGESWEKALLLLAPLVATLTRTEISAFFDLVKDSDLNSLDHAVDSIEVPSAICVTACLSTRMGGISGIGEASEIWSLAARYQDSNQVMPPAISEWKKDWYIKMLPAFAEDWADDIADLYNKLVLDTSDEYSTATPPSFLSGVQSAGYRHTLYDVLRKNIQAYTDIAKENVAAGAPGAAPTDTDEASSL